MFNAVDWNAIFVPRVPLVEIALRGTLVYLTLFLMIRVVLKRQAGAVSVTDLLVIVLIADAVQNAMAGEYRTVPEGILLAGVIVFWSFTLDWLGYRMPAIGRFLHPPPIELVRQGMMLRRNMQREFITPAELWSQLREQGVDSLREVKSARLEGDGHISVIRKVPEPTQTAPKKVTH